MSNSTIPSSDLDNIQNGFQDLFPNSSEINKSGEIIVSLNQQPYFTDHAFQDMIVLPGSAYTEMAVAIYHKIYNKVPQLIRNIKFGNLSILSEEVLSLKYKVSEITNGIKIEFFEQNVNEPGNKSFSTSFELEDAALVTSKKKNNTAEFINNADTVLFSEEFYGRLRSNGNQYGPYFQNIKRIWIKNNEVMGEIDFSGINDHTGDRLLLNSVKYDSFTQLLSSLSKEEDRTFFLSSISEIKIHNPDLPDHVWCFGKMYTQGNVNQFEGDLKVYGDDDTLYLELAGVNFKYLDNTHQKQGLSLENSNAICISSTFTAEPVEDSLKFWNNYFSIPFDIRFAPYNQVFQELLDPQSVLALNKKGFNIILLGLEDWTRRDHKLVPLVNTDNLFEGRSRYILPNQLEIVQLNKYETEYVYKEIFVDKCYLKHGITINDGDTIIDIGANIGLFTIFVNQYCKDPVVYSFEPSPVVYELLKINSMVYGSNVKTFNSGVSDREKTAKFTFYEKSSVFSSFNADENDDKDAIQAVVRNLLRDPSEQEGDSLEDYVEEITSGRLERQYYECRLLSVSDIIRDNEIKKIDLLKIDAEKSELDIIRGIKAEDWNKINQIVIEIHDKSGKVLEEIKGILELKGFDCFVEEEEMLKESGLFNVFAKKKSEEQSNSSLKFKEDKLRDNIDNFINSLEAFVQRSRVPIIIAVTPRSPHILSEPGIDQLYNKYESSLLDKISPFSNIYTISSSSLTKAYPVEHYYDNMGDKLGHITYTLPFYTSIGTALYRLILSVKSTPRKVIALDCDNTLWKGVCGEDGSKGIQISEPYRIFQQLLIEQIRNGMLVCLCSKNNEEDVMEVFRNRDDMLLKTEHLVSWRTNWDSKTSNLISLSKELNLGLDSFIFIDDNPVECAEVRASCPEVLTLQLPVEENIAGFITNTWAFDHYKITEEDKKRTALYKENAQREKHRSGSLTLKDFLDGLNLEIRISGINTENIPRVSQLTFRTNQFNFTTIRRSEQEIREYLSEKGNNCLIVHVSDRFGDYGLVGTLLYSEAGNIYKLDTFLLSCRVLGRGVEYKILAELGRIAAEKGIEYIEIKYIPSLKNKPALNFIEKIGSGFQTSNGNGLIKIFTPEYLASLNYDNYLEEEYTLQEENKSEQTGVNSVIQNTNESFDLSEKFQVIANEFHDASSIYHKVEEYKTRQGKVRENILKPETDIERDIALIWEKVLRRGNLSLDDNFFEAGGDSLKAVQLVASIKRDLHQNISIVDIFECPTIELLSKKIKSKMDILKPEESSATGIERGSRRRNIKLSRKNKNH